MKFLRSAVRVCSIRIPVKLESMRLLFNWNKASVAQTEMFSLLEFY